MKRFTFLLLILSIGHFFAFSQTSIVITEEAKMMSKGSQNGFSVELPQYKLNDLKREWMKYMRKKTKSKTLNTSTDWSMQKGKIDLLSSDTISAFTHFSVSNTSITTSIFVSIKDSFVTTTTNPIVSKNIKNLLFDFAKNAYAKVVEKELSSEKRKLDFLKDDLEHILKMEDKAIEVVTESNHKIEENENELETSKEELEIKQKDIFNQKQRALKMSRKSEERKEQNEIVRELENDKKNHLKHQQNLTKEIANLTTTVRSKERLIDSLKMEQENKKTEIKKQEELVNGVEKKLATIKMMTHEQSK